MVHLKPTDSENVFLFKFVYQSNTRTHAVPSYSIPVDICRLVCKNLKEKEPTLCFVIGVPIFVRKMLVNRLVFYPK